MKLKITETLKVDGSVLNIAENEIKLDITDINFEILDDLKFNGFLKNVKGIIVLSGELNFSYNAICVRCLKPLTKKISIKINERFSNEPDEQGLDYLIEDHYIDLDKTLIDNIFLNLPMKEYCKSDCRGLCAKCGAVIDDGECNCANEEFINPQFEILKKIK